MTIPAPVRPARPHLRASILGAPLLRASLLALGAACRDGDDPLAPRAPDAAPPAIAAAPPPAARPAAPRP